MSRETNLLFRFSAQFKSSGNLMNKWCLLETSLGFANNVTACLLAWQLVVVLLPLADLYLGPCQISMMKFFKNS